MSDNINVKGLSNLYTDPDKWGVWLCVSCISGVAEGNFKIFNGPCCRFPVFNAGSAVLKKGMNSTDEFGTVHSIRRCVGCLITGKACLAPPEDVETELQAVVDQLKIIYDDSQTAAHGEAKFAAVQAAKTLRDTVNRAPYVPHSAHLRMHNGETRPDYLPQSAVHPREGSKSKAAQRARDKADEDHTNMLAAERLNSLQNTPGGRGKKRKYDDSITLKLLADSKEKEKKIKEAHRAHVGSDRPQAVKAGKAWDQKKDKLAKELDAIRAKVQDLERVR